MHATYAFLVDQDKGGIPRVDQFEHYLHWQGDENNWYETLMWVTPDGRLQQLAEAGDWRGRDRFFDEFQALPQDQRWGRALEFARRCAEHEVSWAAMALYMSGGPAGKLPEFEINWPEAGAFLRGQIAQKAQVANPYFLNQAAVVLEQVESLTLSPFSDRITDLYSSMRALDLRRQADGEKIGIVFVDIHT